MALQSLLKLPTNPSFGFGDERNVSKTSEVQDLVENDQVKLSVSAIGSIAGNTERLCDPNSDRSISIQFDKGTTTLAFKYQGGVCVCADSRATGGQYIGSNNVKKIIPINEYMLGTMAGGAADCTYWERVLSERCRLYELRNRERISVAAASKLLANILYNYKGMGLSLGVMIAGWDKKGPGLYMVDNEGNRTPGQIFSVGSGSTYAYGILDNAYSFDMTDEAAYDLGRRAIYHATYRDSYSGGTVRVFHVKQTGWVRVSEEDCKDLHYRFQEENM